MVSHPPEEFCRRPFGVPLLLPSCCQQAELVCASGEGLQLATDNQSDAMESFSHNNSRVIRVMLRDRCLCVAQSQANLQSAEKPLATNEGSKLTTVKFTTSVAPLTTDLAKDCALFVTTPKAAILSRRSFSSLFLAFVCSM